MEPFYFVLAWLAYVACFWLGVFFFDRRQDGQPGRRQNKQHARNLTASLRAHP
jgi:hypothetical protein